MDFIPKGICPSKISFDIDNGRINNISFERGCDGNLKGLAVLLDGLDIDTVISKLEGITCGRKSTSCPDQLAKALKGLRA